jgi:hypothetical protein
MPLILRSTKGSPLTYSELDGNFTFLSGSTSSSFATSASFAQTSSIAFYSYYSNQSTFSAQAVYATSAGTATTALNATTASYAASSSVTVSSSFATTASYATNVPVISTGSFAVTGSNIFIGNQIITGATTIKAPDGNTSLIVSSSYSSSISSSNSAITPTFNGVLNLTGVNPGSPLMYTFDSDIWINYSAISGSQHTQASSTLKVTADNVNYDALNIILSNGITLSPVGIIDNNNYTLWIKDVASGQFYKKDNQLLSSLQTFGLNISLSGDTSTNLGADLINSGFSLTTDPVTTYFNTLTYVSSSTTSFTSSLVTSNVPLVVNSVSGSRIFPTSSGVPTFSGSDGQFVFGTTGGNYFIYTWMNNKWRSGSLV